MNKLSLFTWILGAFTTIQNGPIYAQNEDSEKEDLEVEIIRDMKSTYYSSIQLNPLQLGAIDNGSAFSFAGNIEVVDLVERLGLRLDYNRYYNWSIEDGLSDFNPTLFRLSGSFDFYRHDELTEQSLTLKSEYKTVYYTTVKARLLRAHSINIGFVSMRNQRNLSWNTTTSFVDFNGNTQTNEDGLATGRFFEYNQLLAIGYRYRSAATSMYNTNKFGKLSISMEGSFFLNALLPLSTTVGNLEQIDEAIGAQNKLTTAERMAEVEKWKRIPVGVEFGYTSGQRHSGFVFGLKGGFGPGYVGITEDDIWTLAHSSVFLGYRFLHRKEGVLFDTF